MATLLVDLDGTLVDPAPGIIGSVRHALEAAGVEPPPHEALLWVIGPPLRGSFERLGAEPEAAIAAYRARYGEWGLTQAQVYPGVVEALARLGAEHELLLCTSKPTVFARRVLAHFGLTDFFAEAYGAELDGRFDDKGELIAHILRSRGLAPQACVMIGDRRHDAVAARRNGVAALGVLWGYGSEAELREAGVAVIIKNSRYNREKRDCSNMHEYCVLL